MTIELIAHPFDNVVGLKIENKIEAADIDRIAQLIEAKLQQTKKLRIYAEVVSWSGMSIKALLKDLRFGLRHFQDLEKEVIVSDLRWLERLAKTSDRLFSQIEIKHFSTAEKDKAWEFVAR